MVNRLRGKKVKRLNCYVSASIKKAGVFTTSALNCHNTIVYFLKRLKRDQVLALAGPCIVALPDMSTSSSL